MEIASDKQRRMFFALCNQLGYNSEEAKDRAKAHFNKESFKDLTKDEVNWLIDQLLNVADQREAKT